MFLSRSPRTLLARALTIAFSLALGLAPATATAASARMVTKPLIANPSLDGVVNTMMYTVTVAVAGVGKGADYTARVGFAPADEYTTCSRTSWKWAQPQTFDSTTTRTWTLYNFIPGKAYVYRVLVGTGARAQSTCGLLSTRAAPKPTLPLDLSYLNIQYERGGAGHPSDTKYVILETGDCGGTSASPGDARDYIVALDVENETIVWYLDTAAASGLDSGSSAGWRYQPGTTSTSGRILMSYANRYLYEWAFDGTTVNFYDFGDSGQCDGDKGSTGPCLHHDLYKSDATGFTYTLASSLSSIGPTGTDWEDTCSTDSLFVDDGWAALDDTYTLLDTRSLIDDYGYDPTVYGGPHAAGIASRTSSCDADFWSGVFDRAWEVNDWMHANAIAVSSFGSTDMLDVSLKSWDQILRFDAETGALQWTLSPHPDDSDWDVVKAAGVVGDTGFSDQHGVHAIAADQLMMFDNQGNADGARVLEISLDEATATATIEKSWAMVNAAGNQMKCGSEGTAEVIPDSTDHVLGVCAEFRTVSELDDPTGNSGTSPPLVISLPNGTTDDVCTSGGPDEREDIHGWQRAFPTSTVGEF
jgi:hypothetical protein